MAHRVTGRSQREILSTIGTTSSVFRLGRPGTTSVQ